MKPIKINVNKLDNLNILWSNNQNTSIKLVNLRKNCPCAECKAERDNQSKSYIPIYSDNDLTIKSIEIVGNYAIKIVWGDDHDTGIYIFDYLFSIMK